MIDSFTITDFELSNKLLNEGRLSPRQDERLTPAEDE